jgi:hypothetical protein
MGRLQAIANLNCKVQQFPERKRSGDNESYRNFAYSVLACL